jgi:hypothetical protein
MAIERRLQHRRSLQYEPRQPSSPLRWEQVKAIPPDR